MHPHPDKAHIMRTYRRHIMASKRKFGSARSLIHYRAFLQEYISCKSFCAPLRVALQCPHGYEIGNGWHCTTCLSSPAQRQGDAK